jgi:hypothetical protein
LVVKLALDIVSRPLPLPDGGEEFTIAARFADPLKIPSQPRLQQILFLHGTLPIRSDDRKSVHTCFDGGLETSFFIVKLLLETL